MNDSRSGALNYVTDQHVTKVDEVIKKDCCATVDDIYAAVVLSHDIVHLIIVNTLKFRKPCAQWPPHNLTREQEAYHIAIPLHLLQRYNDCGYNFFLSIVTGENSFCHQFEPESKR